MRIFNTLREIHLIRKIPSRKSYCIFPHLAKCYPTPILPQTSFFSRSITYTLKIRKQNYLAKFRKKPFLYKRIHKESIKHHTLRRYTRKSHTYNQKGTQTNSAQPLQLEKTHLYTSQLSPKLPSKSQKPPNAKAFSLKRQRVYRQTPKYSNPNAKEFQINTRTFFNSYFPLKSLIKPDLPENSVQTEQKALPESSRYSQFMYRQPPFRLLLRRD